MKTGTGKLSPRGHSLEIGTACDAMVEKKTEEEGFVSIRFEGRGKSNTF